MPVNTEHSTRFDKDVGVMTVNTEQGLTKMGE